MTIGTIILEGRGLGGSLGPLPLQHGVCDTSVRPPPLLLRQTSKSMLLLQTDVSTQQICAEYVQKQDADLGRPFDHPKPALPASYAACCYCMMHAMHTFAPCPKLSLHLDH